MLDAQTMFVLPIKVSLALHERKSDGFCPRGGIDRPFLSSGSPSFLRLHLHSRTLNNNFSAYASVPQNTRQEGKEIEEEAQDFQVVTAVRSEYNEIVIVDTCDSRMLLLDSTHNVHSLLPKGDNIWTGSYWDEFASLPVIVPEGPIAIYGLGGGTAARLLLDSWPSLQLEGWEIDEILIHKSREYLGLSNLEERTTAGGGLQVHIGDVLSPSQSLSEGYAGIIVDLFSDGKVLAQLQEAATWLELKSRLKADGRFMVNCGGTNDISTRGESHHESDSADGDWMKNSTIKALATAFPGQVNWKRTQEEQGLNYLALTGPLPDLSLWSAAVPHQLREAVKQWRSCGYFP